MAVRVRECSPPLRGRAGDDLRLDLVRRMASRPCIGREIARDPAEVHRRGHRTLQDLEADRRRVLAGAMMSLDVGLRTDCAGIIAMSGGLYEPDLPDLGPKKGLPVLIAHGVYDDVVPVAYARRAR